jgi:conjugal transfer mating pair stabilization protein TraN
MRTCIMGYLLFVVLIPSTACAMSWCTEKELMFDSADMCVANCPSACTEATRKTEGSSGSCGAEYRGFVYSPSLNRTYALTAGTCGVDGLVSAPDYIGRGAMLKSRAENDAAAILTKFFTTTAWIAAEAYTSFHCGKTGRYHFDSGTCAAACSGTACTGAIHLPTYNTVKPERFFWRNGDPLTYRNFAAGEPDNAATVDDLQAGFAPKGEHWVEMGEEGSWVDAGKHTSDQSHSRPIVVQFSGALDCVNGDTESATPAPPGDLTGSVCGKDANADGRLTAEEFRQCASTMDGYLCPIDSVDCEPGYNPVVCPDGGVLNTERDMCQVDPVVTCPAGYSWDRVSDRCIGPVSCPDNGVLNGISDRCEKIPAAVCPIGYTYDTSQGICAMPPACQAGAYVPTRDRCEFAWTPRCPSGWVYDSSANTCGRAPVCSSGSYNTAFNLCVKPSLTGCPSGYAHNPSRGRCEMSPQCARGTFDPSTDRCMWTSTGSYAATATYSCPNGGTLSGTTCHTTSTYAATATTTGGVSYSVSLHRLGSILGSSCVCNTGLGLDPAGSGGMCSCGVVGYMAPAFFAGAVSLHKVGSRIGTSCMCTTAVGVDPGGGSGCSCGVVGYVASGSFSGAVPVHTVGSSIGSSCVCVSDIGVEPYSGGGCSCGIVGYMAPSSGSFGGTATYSCNTGDSLSGTTCTHTGSYSATVTYTCPSGGTLSGATCQVTTTNQVNPSCPGGSFDAVTDLCFASIGKGCDDGFSYDAGSDQCVKSPDCGAGVLNVSADRCELTVTRDCGAFALDGANGICYSQPVCDRGAYDPARNLCVATLTRDCGANYTLDAGSGMCRTAPPCPPDPGFPLSPTIAYSDAMNACVSDPVHSCPASSGYAYLGPPVGKCEVIPVCVKGAYDPAKDSCLTGDLICPYGDFRCMRNGDRSRCSPFTCGDTEEEQADMSSYQDNGERDPATGQCTGQLYIFNGKPGECKEPGVSTTWFQCCSTDESGFLFIEKVCGTGDKLTASAMKAKRTHFVGTYCKKKFPLIGCVQSAQVHCVFQSKLGRIVQEQGRMQLKNFQGGSGPDWGTAEKPNCRGFTPEEFQFLDFAKMDLSEFFADIKAKAGDVIQGELEGRVDEFYDKTVH